MIFELNPNIESACHHLPIASSVHRCRRHLPILSLFNLALIAKRCLHPFRSSYYTDSAYIEILIRFEYIPKFEENC